MHYAYHSLALSYASIKLQRLRPRRIS